MANFNILGHLDRLTADGGSQGKNELSYQCPVCNSPNFKVTIAGPKIGQYFARGCACMDSDSGKQAVIDAISPRWEKPARAKSSQTFTYEMLDDTTPVPLVQVRRNDDGHGKRKFSQWHKADNKWVSGLPEELKSQIHLYRIFDRINQTAIKNGETVLIVEGEGLVEDLHKLGIAATCSIGGGGKWTDYGYSNYLKDLEGTAVVICPDRDVPGIKHAESIAKDFPDALWLYANPTSFMWERVPENKGYDLGDWIEDGATKEMILGAIEPRRTPKPNPQFQSSNHELAEKPAKRAIPDQLIDIGQEPNITYFATSDGIIYADIQEGEIRSTLAIREKSFKQYLRSTQFDRTGRSPGSDAVQQAIDTLEAIATRTAEKRDVSVRLTSHENKIFIDLADESWQAIEVDAQGWRLTHDAPVRFIRGACAALPMPIAGGDVDEFRELCQFDEDTWVKILTFLIQTLAEEKGYPVLLLHGGAGSGKTTLTRSLKKLTDPSTSKFRKNVGDIREFAIYATRRRIVAIDNLSGLSTEQSDILCTASTGGGHSQRTLHSDSGETVFNFCNPLILNGIDSIATRGDLLNRSILITLHAPTDRLSEREFEDRLEEMQPRVLGGLLDLLSQVLGILPSIEYSGNAERFPAFIKMGLALEQVMKWELGTFLRVIGEAREEAHETAIESSPVGQAIQDFMLSRASQESWTGTPATLLSCIKNHVEESVSRSKYFPQDATRLSKTLNRLAPDLEAIGIQIQSVKTNGVRLFTISCVAKKAQTARPRTGTLENHRDATGVPIFGSVPVPQHTSIPCTEGVMAIGRDAGDARDAKNALNPPRVPDDDSVEYEYEIECEEV